MDSEDNNSGDESSTTTFGGERSVALLPGVSKVKVYCGNGTMGGSADVENASNRTRTYARLSTRTSSDPATAVTNDSVDRIRCVVTVSAMDALVPIENYFYAIPISNLLMHDLELKVQERKILPWNSFIGRGKCRKEAKGERTIS